jgi:hypothetical protein
MTFPQICGERVAAERLGDFLAVADKIPLGDDQEISASSRVLILRIVQNGLATTPMWKCAAFCYPLKCPLPNE